MCGIAGFWTSNSGNQTELANVIEKMTLEIAHRGPDGFGHWVELESGICLGHRRLSILDLSESGRQPMQSHSNRYTISYNGEIYNFQDLRNELPVERWRSDCDTEVILEAFEHWGIDDSVAKFNGMFAIAVWDRQERKLFLIRDRVGIKPLYYYQDATTFAFASELRPFQRLPGFCNELSPDAVNSLIARGHIGGARCIYKKAKKLEPGSILELSSCDAKPKLRKFWDFESTVTSCLQDPFDGENAADELETLLLASVKRRMIADVPLGAFLSGGIDSSLVVALMQTQSSSPVKTFSIGFNEKAFDESPYARAVAKHLGTDHTELIVDPSHGLDIVPNMSTYYDEPFADQSLIPTLMVSQLARQHVTVSLSGDGGDELFGGYSRYFEVLERWNRLSKVPQFARLLLSNSWQGMQQRLPTLASKILGANRADGFDRLFRYANAEELGGFYQCAVEANSVGYVSPAIKRNANPIRTFDAIGHELPGSQNLLRLMLIDAKTYLPNDILTKVDRASMHHGLEARVPLLDHEVIQFAFRLGNQHRTINGSGKKILKDILAKYVPLELFDRPKMGFGVPIAEWLRNELRDWAESLLSKKSLEQSGLIDVQSVQRRWQDHLKGTNRWYGGLWRVLVLQNWLRAQKQQVQQIGKNQ